jgi:hypothetical protein
MRKKKDKPIDVQKLDEKYGDVLDDLINNDPTFCFAAKTRRRVRDYSTGDFVRDYFIPNL